MDSDLLRNLRSAYNLASETRDQQPREVWKTQERERFLSLLKLHGSSSLLEIGAGTGLDGLFFKEEGLRVHCIDLSDENVARCRNKGLSAEVMDCTQMTFNQASFDAAYAMNSLLHIPHSDFDVVLDSVQKILRPDGLFYLGQYGGIQSEGIWEDDHYRPKRFFAFFTDDQIQATCARYFHLFDVRSIVLENLESLHFQSLILDKGSSNHDFIASSAAIA